MSLTYSYFNHPSWRRVVGQLREIFSDLHENVEWRDDEKFKTEQINLSELCLNSSQKYITVIENELKLIRENTEEELSIKESFQLTLKVWKLCQIIFIKSSPSGALLLDLQDWYRATNNIDPMIQELFSSTSIDTIYTDENFWLLMLISIAQGRIDTARHLISFHPQKNQSAFRAIDEQLRTMPNFAVCFSTFERTCFIKTLCHLSLFEFKTKWEIWQKKCIQVLTNENFTVEETGTLEIICKMLCADESTFLDLKPIYNNWYYMLISYISYSNPTFNISDLHIHLASRTFMNRFENDFEEFDAIIHSIFDFDVDVVIKDCVNLFGNNLFSAHLLDILYLSGKLQLNKYELVASGGGGYNHPSQSNYLNGESSFVHEQHLLEYGKQLLTACSSTDSLSLYQTAFDYLVKCRSLEVKGIDVVEAHMERIPLTFVSETTANKLFHIAFEYDLHDLAFSIGRIMQMRALKRGMYGTALGWNVRIKDASFGTFLAEKILEDFFNNGDVNLLDLSENMSKEIIYCDRLIFLSKYREFYKLVNSETEDVASRFNNLKQAATLLIQLLEAPKLVPYKYKKIVLFDLFKLINEKDLFNDSQLFSILRMIQNYENRRDVFREGCKFNRLGYENRNLMSANENHSNDGDIEILDEAKSIEVSDRFDQTSWRDFLNQISKRVAESFVKCDIDF